MIKKLVPAAIGLAFFASTGFVSAASSPTVLTTAQMDGITGAGYEGGDYCQKSNYNGGHAKHRGDQKNYNNTRQVNVAALNNVSVLSGNGVFGHGKVYQDFAQVNKNSTWQGNQSW